MGPIGPYQEEIMNSSNEQMKGKMQQAKIKHEEVKELGDNDWGKLDINAFLQEVEDSDGEEHIVNTQTESDHGRDEEMEDLYQLTTEKDFLINNY